MIHSVQDRLGWRLNPAEYEAIRALWIAHSKAEDARDLAGLLATLTADCVYELVPTGRRWEGHEGARQFYTGLLSAFPDARFSLQDIVIGPQGVFEATLLEGTHRGTWEGVPPTGRPIRLLVLIYFPWDPQARLFAGERIYYDRAALAEQLEGRTGITGAPV
ncbi:MAG: ester cyclase [Armatimonadota bacterium]|nr:ester cyclase [Armatimonadota bacterium]MDR7402855.1 ester cyclase [Armatimonadota bacterium]MDR7404784.1 ester cyclase [Armatimonadota bacterium]MDR7438237.1 ester cyclase [Armatimonadota bacterium]MDR7510380.1 ester cyclase [Armatimonadota bacterium]